MNGSWLRTLSLITCLSLSLGACTKKGGDDNNTSGGVDTSGGDPVDVTGQLSNRCSASKSTSKIFNGDSCPAALGPVVLLIGVDKNGRSLYECSGTFLTKRKILTAGHCDPALIGPGTRLVAITQEQLDGPGPVGVAGISFTQHPLSRGDTSSPYDIGIVTLSKEVDAATLPLLVSEDTSVGQGASLYGFGLEENQQTSVVNGKSALAPEAARVEVAAVTSQQITFASPSQGACPGDSGGPAVRRGSNGVVGIIGTTSGGLTSTCEAATLSFEDFERTVAGKLTPDEIASIEDQYPDGVPQDYFVNTQSDSVLNFILKEVPDARTE